jgi:hypothetical protein
VNSGTLASPSVDNAAPENFTVLRCEPASRHELSRRRSASIQFRQQRSRLGDATRWRALHDEHHGQFRGDQRGDGEQSHLHEQRRHVTDWIELYNPGGVAFDASGFGLSDNTVLPARWTFPAGVTIPAGGRLVVRFDSASPASTANGAILKHGIRL